MADDRPQIEEMTCRMLLGAMMICEPEAAKALGSIRPDAMVGPARVVLDAIRALNEAGQPSSLPIVIEYLQAHGKLAEVGGAGEICSWVDNRLPAESIAGTIENVNNAALRRELVLAGRDISHEATNPPWVEEALTYAENRVASLHAPRPDRPESVGEILRRMADTPERVIPTGFSHFDRLLGGGLRPGQLVVLGGRPGMGKTAMLCALCDRIALSGRRVLFVSGEMSREEIVNDRLVPLHYGKLPDGFQITITRSTRLGDVRAMLLRTKPDVLAVDYLQLMRGKGEKRYEQVDYVARSLKVMAGEFQLPVIVAAAVNRAAEDGGKVRIPVLSDLREGGEIEYAADIVAFIHRPKPYDPADQDAALHLVKQRNGPPGRVGMRFKREQKTFVEVEDSAPLMDWQ